MCGRFALGLSGGELEEALARDYFVPPAQHQGAQDQDDDEQQDDNEGDELGQAGGAAEDGQGNAPREEVVKSTRKDALRWTSSEAQTTFRPRYNVAPTTQIPVLRRTRKDKETYELDLMKWGLVPSWYTEPPSAGLSTINAQCESVFEGTPAWRQPRQTKRCLIVAQGFYEWLNKPGAKEKQPYFVKRKDGKLMAFGNYDPVTSCTILTVPVDKQLRFLHTRMPAILPDHSAISLWLSPDGWSNKLKTIIKPFEGELEYYAVDRGVGKVQNDSADFIKPVAQKKGSLDSFFAKQAALSPSKPSGSTSSRKKSSASPPPSTKSLEKSASSPSTSSSSAKDVGKMSAKKDEDEEKEEAMNPDEADLAKLAKIEEDLNAEKEAKPMTAAKGKGKKRAKPGSGSEEEKVDVLDLCDSDGGKDDEKDEDKPSPKKKKKAGKEEKQTDGKGNEELTNFFPVVE
ncbi:hypothetical protein JCM10295v2_006798 [Rhodotorula toruloides]